MENLFSKFNLLKSRYTSIILKKPFTLFTKSVGLYVNILSFIAPNKATQLAYALFSEPERWEIK
jgi:hypothetical protein